MGRQYDVNIKLAYAADEGKTFSVDVIEAGKPFDIIVDFEVGSSIRAFNGDYTLYLTVRNQTKLDQVITVMKSGSVVGQQTLEPATITETANVPGTWTAGSGDVLDVLASLVYKTGSVDDQDATTSPTFLVA